MSTMVATFDGMPGLIAPARSTAQSSPAKQIEFMRENIRGELLQSYVMSNAIEKVLAELNEVRAEASCTGWDGYGAHPLNPAAYDFAKRFFNAFPSSTPLPEISADTDGEVALDWIFGERRALTVSIGPTGRCTFAWMLGQKTNRGTDWIDDGIPEAIVFALGQLVRAATPKRTD
ncbi:MAG: hypothetical protein WB424_17155 [Terracidiphilus sp.]